VNAPHIDRFRYPHHHPQEPEIVSDISLKGMTWDHPRGYDPLVACSAEWRRLTGVTVEWDKRSLQDFESFPVEELAQRYDFIVIDHPHVGQVTAEDCLLPLDVDRGGTVVAARDGSVGASWRSYNWRGRQWALPIDAAAQVQAWRPDLIAAPTSRWSDVMALADAGRVLCPMRVPHSLMVFFTLAANLGRPSATGGPGELIDAETGAVVFKMMRDLTARIDPVCFAMDPIAVLEAMAEKDSHVAIAPLIYGYVSYAHEDFRDRRVAFADIPVVGDNGPIGSTLGGTGIAVSARTAYPKEATDFACWVASGDVQRTIYAAAGGQPGHAAAWDDPVVNAAAGNFYRATRATLEGAWVRPRHDGYMGFQEAGAEAINQALTKGGDGDRLVAELNRMFRQSFG
jgi:multiple sugar transport system substrate-binding protein